MSYTMSFLLQFQTRKWWQPSRTKQQFEYLTTPCTHTNSNKYSSVTALNRAQTCWFSVFQILVWRIVTKSVKLTKNKPRKLAQYNSSLKKERKQRKHTMSLLQNNPAMMTTMTSLPNFDKFVQMNTPFLMSSTSASSTFDVVPARHKEQQTKSSYDNAVGKAQSSAVSGRSRSSSGTMKYENTQSLGSGFVPGPYDVICARGKAAWNHSGNKHFRALIKQNTARYSRVQSKLQRSGIVTEIVDVIRSKGNGFVKQEDDGTGRWIEVGNLLARERVGQHFRNALNYKSSFKNKKHRRCAAVNKLAENLHNILSMNEQVSEAMDKMQAESDAATTCGSGSTMMMDDEELLKRFDQHNSNMLELLKGDKSLAQRYTATIISSGVEEVGDDDDQCCSTTDSDDNSSQQ